MQKLEKLKVIIEALQQWIDNQPDLDELDAPTLYRIAIARQLLDDCEAEFVELVGGAHA